MHNKKIPTSLGTIVLIIIAVTVFGVVWKWEKDQGDLQSQSIIAQPKKSTDSQKEKNKASTITTKEIPYEINPEKPICDKKTNLVIWDESKNGSYYTKNTNYFTFSYPCDYNISFSDMGGFYRLNKVGNIENKINISKSSYSDERINGVKKIYSNPHTKILSEKLNIEYPYKAYEIQINKNEQACGECLENPGHTYNGIEIRINDKLYYYFQAESLVSKDELFSIAETFAYHIVKQN